MYDSYKVRTNLSLSLSLPSDSMSKASLFCPYKWDQSCCAEVGYWMSGIADVP